MRDGPATGLIISQPLISRLDGAMSIYFARKIARPDGHFLGVAFVGVKPTALFKHHPSLTTIGEKTFSLFYADATIAWREPGGSGLIGRPLPHAERWLKAAAAGGGVYRSDGGAFDPQGKYIAVRQVPDLPLFVNVAVTDRAALKNWTPRAVALLGSAFVCLALIGALLFSQTRLIVRLSRSRLRSWMRARRLLIKQRELAATQARFGLTLNVMSQGMAMFDRERRLVVHNPCFAELYGLDSDALRPGMHIREICALRIAAGAYCGETPEDYYALLDAPLAPKERTSSGAAATSACTIARPKMAGGRPFRRT